MKINQYITVIPLIIGFLGGAHIAQAEGTEHTEKVATPNGGRLISTVTPHAEFFVTSDRFVQITFVNAEGVVIEPAQQVVSLVGGDRSAATKLNFVLANGVLRSTEPLPEQPNMPIVLSIKSALDAKTVREKFYLKQHVCGGCDYEEYACICGH